MSTISMDILKKSLALSIACGRSVRLWAKRHDVDVTTALEWYLQNELRPLVEQARLRVADRMVGRLLSAAKVAIAQLIRLCTKSPSDNVRLSASRAILANWLKISEHYSMDARLNALLLDQDLEDAKSKEWCPPSPYKSHHNSY